MKKFEKTSTRINLDAADGVKKLTGGYIASDFPFDQHTLKQEHEAFKLFDESEEKLLRLFFDAAKARAAVIKPVLAQRQKQLKTKAKPIAEIVAGGKLDRLQKIESN